MLLAGTLAGAVILVALARLSYHVRWPASWTGVLCAMLLGLLAFGALGTLIGVALRTARAAQGLGVLLWFVLMMVSGSGPPPEVLGGVLRAVGDAGPLKHLVVAIQDPWLGRGVNWTQMLILGVVVAVPGALAVPALRQRT